MELLLSKIKRKESRAFMILCDIYLFIVIIIIRQLFKTHQTTQEKSGEPFFSLCTPHHTFFQNLTKQQKQQKEAELPKSIKSNPTIKFVVKTFCLFYIYIFSITFSISYTTLSRRNHTSYLINIIIT